MRFGPVLMRVGVLVGASLLAVACQGSGVAVQSIESLTASPTTSAASSPAEQTDPGETSTSGSSTALSPSPSTEQADRDAAAEQWVKSWDIYLAMATTAIDERDAVAATVTVDPAKARMLTDAAEFDRQGLQTYGQLGHRISWPQAINGSNSALIDDCQDRSASGAVEVSSGNKITVGVARDHYQGSLIRGEDGVWRVADVFYLRDEPC